MCVHWKEGGKDDDTHKQSAFGELNVPSPLPRLPAYQQLSLEHRVTQPAAGRCLPDPLRLPEACLPSDTSSAAFGVAVSHPAAASDSLLSNSWGIRSSGARVSMVAVLDTAGFPGNPPSHPSFSASLWMYGFMFIYFPSGFTDRVFLLSGLFCYPWVKKWTNTARKWILFIVGKWVCIQGKKMCSTFSPHDEFQIHVEINQKYPWKGMGFLHFISTGDSQSCLFEINSIKGDPLPTLWWEVNNGWISIS